MNYLSNIVRSEGDPKVIRTGPSSLAPTDRLGRALGWFSLGLGLTQLLAPQRITRALGMEGHEGLVRAYGAREIGSGVLSLSVDRDVGLWSRVAGDGVDALTLCSAMRRDNPKRGNVAFALATVLAVTALDVVGASAVTARHARGRGNPVQYRDRSGFPQGIEKARGAARDFRSKPEVRTAPKLAQFG